MGGHDLWRGRGLDLPAKNFLPAHLKCHSLSTLFYFTSVSFIQHQLATADINTVLSFFHHSFWDSLTSSVCHSKMRIHCWPTPCANAIVHFFLLLFFSARWLAWGRHCASKSAYRKANSSTKSACWPSQTWQLWHTQTATRPIQTHALSIKWLHNPSQWSLWDAKGSYLFTLSKTFKLSQRKKCYPFIHIFSENNIWMWYTVEIHYSSAAAFQQTFNNMHFDWSQQEMQIIYILFVMVQFH